APALATVGKGASLRVVGAPLTVAAGTLGEVINDGTCELVGDGQVRAFHLDAGGSGYRSAPAVALTGAGKGALAQATLSVAAVRMTNLGRGYTSAPTVTFSDPGTAGGRSASGVAVLDAQGAMQQITITDAGRGYLDAPTVSIDGGGGSDARGLALCRVSGIVVLAPGTGYTTAPTVALDGGGGTGAQATAFLQSTTLAYSDPAGTCTLINKGTLTQDGALLLFDRASAKVDPGSLAGFRNEGTWTITRGSMQYVSSTGLATDALAPCVNAGTLAVLDGSSLPFIELTNTGTMRVGGGASLASPAFSERNLVLRNGAKGSITLFGGTRERPVVFGSVGPNRNGHRNLINGAADAPAVLEIGSSMVMIGGYCAVDNAAGSRMAIRRGASLALLTNDNGLAFNSPEWREARLSNFGLLELAGGISASANQWGPIMIENGGTLVISGDVVYDRKMDARGMGVCTQAALVNHDQGTITGDGTFTYLDSTGSTENHQKRAFSMALLLSGTIAPGVPDLKASGVDKPGVKELKRSAKPATLTFVDVDATLGAKAYYKATGIVGIPDNDLEGGATFALSITGPEGSCDQVVFKRVDDPRAGGSLELTPGFGSTLDIRAGQGVRPKGVYTVITATVLNGQFERLRYQGKDQVPYTVRYTPTTVEVVFP
ncbi:MAG: hypothetical protein H0W72_07380, partial [Planctomycetes bacterium]|nr:hypothetical protein [Planctomycetota bacterium]